MSEIKVNKISPRTNCGTVTLGDSGDTFSIPAGVTLTNSGTATGFGPTGAVSWNTTKITANPNPAVSGVGYFCDTSSAAFTVTLPAAPSAGAIVALSDYTGTWRSNNITVGRNSSNINGAASDLILNANNTTATLIYVDATEGWRVIDTGSLSEVNVPLFVTATGGTITTCGNFKIHSFTGPGTFTVSCAGNPLGSTAVDYLVVAGGGAGGVNMGGGGGAGGYRTTFPSPGCNAGSFPITVTSFPITVGGGGSAGYPVSTSGTNSVFSTITSTGGGHGAGVSAPDAAETGGSGGGGGGHPSSTKAGAAGNTPPTSPSQGNAGGTGTPGGAGGAGGGGASVIGSNPPNANTGGNGGAGSTNLITGSPVAYAGGGGGGAFTAPSGNTGGTGGTGGGGPGGANGATGGTAGVANTGGGGGGEGSATQLTGNGGSGIVIIRYKFQ